jgi:hypothetical protein
MKISRTWVLMVACSWPIVARTQWQLLPDAEPQRIFAGDARKITVIWYNTGNQTAPTGVSAQTWQASSATAVKIGHVPSNTLQVLPRRTMIESAVLDFPLVTAKTKFLVQWCKGPYQATGTTAVLVYPTNLLAELKLLGPGDGRIPGILEPCHQLNLLLKSAGVKFVDLEEMNLNDFSGPLAVIGPCRPDDPEWNGLTERVSRLARRGTAVVWIQSSPQKSDEIHPSYYIVPKARAVIVVVDPALVADLPDRPQSQLNLIYFCKLALQPEPFQLPELTNYTKL